MANFMEDKPMWSNTEHIEGLVFRRFVGICLLLAMIFLTSYVVGEITDSLQGPQILLLQVVYPFLAYVSGKTFTFVIIRRSWVTKLTLLVVVLVLVGLNVAMMSTLIQRNSESATTFDAPYISVIWSLVFTGEVAWMNWPFSREVG